MTQNGHVPVLLGETIDELGLKSNSLVLDATFGGGGHAREILKRLGADGKLIGLDWDSGAISNLQDEFGGDGRVKLIHLNFSEFEKVARSLTAVWRRPDAVLFDLGLSSLQLKASGRGFSFNAEEGLEMTFDRSTSPNARELVSSATEDELEEIIRTCGEEPFARKIAKAIVQTRRKRKISTAKDLAETIAGVIRGRGRIHPATRTFQALRIYLNREFENISSGIEGAFRTLNVGGRIAVISYHSLEDRIVKNIFKEKVKLGEGRLLHKKPIRPQRAEILQNSRSRSAKLRVIEKIK